MYPRISSDSLQFTYFFGTNKYNIKSLQKNNLPQIFCLSRSAVISEFLAGSEFIRQQQESLTKTVDNGRRAKTDNPQVKSSNHMRYNWRHDIQGSSCPNSYPTSSDLFKSLCQII